MASAEIFLGGIIFYLCRSDDPGGLYFLGWSKLGGKFISIYQLHLFSWGTQPPFPPSELHPCIYLHMNICVLLHLWGTLLFSVSTLGWGIHSNKICSLRSQTNLSPFIFYTSTWRNPWYVWMFVCRYALFMYSSVRLYIFALYSSLRA